VLSGTKEHDGDDRDTVLAAVRMLAGRQDHHVDQAVAELCLQPQQVRVSSITEGHHCVGVASARQPSGSE